MFAEDIVFILAVMFFINMIFIGYIIVELNTIKTLILDYTYYCQIGGSDSYANSVATNE